MDRVRLTFLLLVAMAVMLSIALVVPDGTDRIDASSASATP
jgi:hypothetical protein